ncbi:hypothetical protein [Algibacter sp. PT7-4]|uniref:hypothetical protein n=1 Tax=Algibacter ulvanivorans TaxID=3400999 RepID=UPI003AACD89A
MKKNILIILSCILIMTSCSLNDNDNATPQEIKYLWHLVKVTGGIAGVNEQFETNVITWSFNNETETLVVNNKNTDDSIEDSLDSGTYSFSVLEENNTTYLIIDDIELGSFEVSGNILTINQNNTSTGNGTDGFIYTFQVETIVAN